MKPLQLTLSGFRSYMNEATIDFEGRTLFAIVGPTGAGKSSILDGICYALYGKTPRVTSNTTSLICSRSDAARVRLLLSVDGRAYEITRVVRRRGEGQNVFVDCSSGESINGKAEITARISDLVGLTFEAFCSSVLLAQNKFASFLESRPGEQMKTLKGVFRIDQIDLIRQAAKEKGSELDLDLREVSGALSQIPADIGDRLRAAKQRVQLAGKALKALEAAVPREEELAREIAQAEKELGRAEQDQERAASWLEQIPAPESFAELVERDERLRVQLAEADAALQAAIGKESAAARSFEEIQAELGTLARLATVQARAEERSRVAASLEVLGGKSKAARDRAAVAEAEARAAEDAARAAGAALDDARARRRAAEQAHRAHALRSELKPGAPCPVCEQIVAAVPTGPVPKALTEIEAAERAAELTDRQARETHAAASQEVVASRRDASNAAERLGEQKAGFARLEDEIGDALGEVADPSAEVKSRIERVDAAGAGAARARSALDAARTARDELAASETAVGNERRELAGRLIRICAQADAEPPGLDAGAAQLAECARSVGSTVVHALDDARVRARDAGKILQQARARTIELRAGLGIDPTVSVVEAVVQARSERERSEDDVRRLEEQAAAAEALRAREKSLEARRSLYTRLTTDLTDSKFIKFLLEERRHLLSELGSGQFHALTGRYRFDEDFNVIDEFDGEKLRSVDTLSGGEIFLASLALALGLAEAVARQGGRLQSFFLDEGFGSLDADSLDLALRGIEQVVSADRVIGLVSHVPALAACIDDKIELDKGADGMTVVRP